MRTLFICLTFGLAVSCSKFDNLGGASKRGSSDSNDSGMEYIEICKAQNDCKKFSRLVMGTDHLVQGDWSQDGQKEIDEKKLFEILDEAALLGINFFDTSPIYVGGIENKLGKWIKSRKESKPDQKLYVLSKGGFPFDLFYSKKLEPGTHSNEFKDLLRKQEVLAAEPKILQDGSTELTSVPPGTYASRLFGDEKQITQRISDELKHTENNLNNDVAVYLMHRDDGDYFKFNEISREKAPVKTIMQSLSSEQLAKRYWSIGWSNWQTDRISQSISLADQNKNLHKPIINSSYFSLFEMSNRSIHAGGVQVMHKEMMDSEFQKGIKQMPYSPLGGFSVLDKPEPRWENAKKAAKIKFDQGDAYWQNVYPAIFTEANEARIKRVEEFTAKFNKEHNSNYTIDQMINAYALAHKRTDFLAVGPISIEQLRRTVGSLKLAKMLTEKDLEYLYSGK